IETPESHNLSLSQGNELVIPVSGSLSPTCAVSDSALSTGEDWWHWIRQPPGKGLLWLRGTNKITTWLLLYLPLKHVHFMQTRHLGFLFRNTSRNGYYLSLNSLTTEDTATYHCAANKYYHPTVMHPI
uniref:Ig-like domain-containing protein n=1 Tax=Gopherus evgoodei TaxID=1825980 RepID=A0A8C5F332_9SAUR